MPNFGSIFGTGGGGPGSFFGSSPMMPASGGGSGGFAMGGGGSNPQVQAYMQYLSQALPSINNGLRAGTIQPGQALQNFQGPQSFGIPSSGFGEMMGGGSGGFDMNAIMQLLQRMGMGGGSPSSGNPMDSIAQMVAPQQGGYHPSVTPYYGGGG